MSDERSSSTDDVVFRRFRDDDLYSLVALMGKVPEVARAGEDISMSAVREQLNWPGHVPTRDRWVVGAQADPERLVGFTSIFKASTTPTAYISMGMHPDWRRRGIGSELLRRALVDAQKLSASDAVCYIGSHDAVTPGFLTRRGFESVAAYVELAARPDTRFPLPQWPDGFTIRSWRDDSDVSLLVEAMNRCYEGLWGHNVSTADEVAHWLPALDTTGISFLFGPDGELAGVVRAEMRDGSGNATGVIDAPGVVTRWRGAGLYRLLMLHALRWYAHKDPMEYRIESWGDASATLDEYQALGFAVSRRDVMYRRRLDAS